jgi:hypothetical protein
MEMCNDIIAKKYSKIRGKGRDIFQKNIFLN